MWLQTLNYDSLLLKSDIVSNDNNDSKYWPFVENVGYTWVLLGKRPLFQKCNNETHTTLTRKCVNFNGR